MPAKTQNSGKRGGRRSTTWKPGIPSPNPIGRPKDGESWAAIIKSVGEMYPSDIISFIGINNDLGRNLRQMPQNVQMKYLVTTRIFAQLMYEPTSGLWKELMERVEGKAKEGKELGENNNTPKILSLPADLIAPSFFDVYRDARDRKHMEYLLKGGRGSTKSSFASLDIIFLLVNNPNIHALAMRQVANTLRDSVYSQIIWAINILGLSESFKCTTSPLEIEYIPTGQKISFRGADKPEMVKSIKPTFGYIGILWFEELDQFHGPEEIRKIEQSVLRGGEEMWEFKTYNPPRTSGNWVNKYALTPKPNQYQHHSTYLDVPKEWLGQVFIDEAEYLKSVNPVAYNHEYLGEVVGSGGQVFDNLKIRAIMDDEIRQFDHIGQGVDWGYYPDPFAWTKSHYDAARHTLYIFDELRAQKAGNKETYSKLVNEKNVQPDDLIIADSAEPKSIGDYRAYGLSCRGVDKSEIHGKSSVAYSMKWLQSLNAIIIDPSRCPYSTEEFTAYELEQDKDGNYISEYPDHNNHFIDSVRYRTSIIWRRRGE